MFPGAVFGKRTNLGVVGDQRNPLDAAALQPSIHGRDDVIQRPRGPVEDDGVHVVLRGGREQLRVLDAGTDENGAPAREIKAAS
jgi:hypothetical protein